MGRSVATSEGTLGEKAEVGANADVFGVPPNRGEKACVGERSSALDEASACTAATPVTYSHPSSLEMPSWLPGTTRTLMSERTRAATRPQSEPSASTALGTRARRSEGAIGVQPPEIGVQRSECTLSSPTTQRAAASSELRPPRCNG